MPRIAIYDANHNIQFITDDDLTDPNYEIAFNRWANNDSDGNSEWFAPHPQSNGPGGNAPKDVYVAEVFSTVDQENVFAERRRNGTSRVVAGGG